MLDSMRALKAGKMDDVDDKLIYPLTRWCSGSIRDLPWCQVVNKYLFSCDRRMVTNLLSLGLQDKNPYVKYPKATKEKDDKMFALRKILVKRYYSWSEQEFQRNLSNLEYVDWEEIAMALGCDKKERKLLGIPEIKITNNVVVPKAVVKAKKTLFDF